MKLHVVQAEYGDCLILQSGVGKNSTTVLIDGGHYQTFEKYLKLTLQKLPRNGKLDSFLTLNLKSKGEQKKTHSSISSIIMKGFQQAMVLTSLAKSLRIAINPKFDKVFVIEHVPKSIKLNDITFSILGPTMENLKKLRKEWKNWLNNRKLNQYSEFELLQI